jgi:nucleotide-binding universal stress UspA family protein
MPHPVDYVNVAPMARPATTSRYISEPLVDSVLCVTDFSRESMNAFAHALTLAMNTRCHFTLLQVSKKEGAPKEWSGISGVRGLLERWGYLESGTPECAMFERLQLDVTKVVKRTHDSYKAVREILNEKQIDVVVVATGGAGGFTSWIRPSVAETAPAAWRTMTLVVPARENGFVSQQTGYHTLRNIVVPVSPDLHPETAITYAMRFAVFSLEEVINVHLLHVGDARRSPQVQVPKRPYLTWRHVHRTGNPVSRIIETAREVDADLIVMSTPGRRGFLDSMLLTVPDQVVRLSPCPVLAVPV